MWWVSRTSGPSQRQLRKQSCGGLTVAIEQTESVVHPHLTTMPEHIHGLARVLSLAPRNDQKRKQLIETLRKSADKPMSREERRKQMISWVYGQLPARMGVSLEEVEEYLKDRL